MLFWCALRCYWIWNTHGKTHAKIMFRTICNVGVVLIWIVAVETNLNLNIVVEFNYQSFSAYVLMSILSYLVEYLPQMLPCISFNVAPVMLIYSSPVGWCGYVLSGISLWSNTALISPFHPRSSGSRHCWIRLSQQQMENAISTLTHSLLVLHECSAAWLKHNRGWMAEEKRKIGHILEYRVTLPITHNANWSSSSHINRRGLSKVWKHTAT